MAAKKASFGTFSDVGNTYRNCHLDWWGVDTPTSIANGFKAVADLAVTQSIEDQRHPDFFFRPIAFLYRHYLEVQLKRLVQLGGKLVQAPIPADALETHDLMRLWKVTKQIFGRVWEGADTSYLTPVDEVIADFHNLDINGQAFRYYTDRKGTPQLQNAPRVVSLPHLRERMDEVYDVLTGCETGIQHYLSESP
jgi:hypothetical protein